MPDGASYKQQTAEAARRVVRLRSVVIGEHPSVTTVAKQRTASRPHVLGRRDPARRLQVELLELLQIAVTLLGQQLEPHCSRHLERAALRLVFLACGQRLAVVAEASASRGAFGGAVAEH